VDSILRVGTFWRCGDGLVFQVPPLASGARLTTLRTFRNRAADRWSLRNFLPRSSLFMGGKARNRMRRDLDCMANVLMGFHWSTFSKPNPEFDLDFAPCNFWAFSTMKREWSTVYSTFSKSGWEWLPREVLRKRDRHRTSTEFRLGVIRRVHKLRKWPSYNWAGIYCQEEQQNGLKTKVNEHRNKSYLK
jgi:hypothetical protein